MAVAIIYHHEERTRAHEFAAIVEQAGHDVLLAPLGLEVGSGAWDSKVVSDLKESDLVLYYFRTNQ